MRYKQLGRSGLLVSDLCLGTMIFGEEASRGTLPAEGERMIHRYLDAGGNHIDTADVYVGGRSEEIVGHIASARGASYSQIPLAWLRAQPVVASDILGARTPKQLEDNLGAAEITLTDHELSQLDSASARPSSIPIA